MKYSYTTDGEQFHGDFDSPQEAALEAMTGHDTGPLVICDEDDPDALFYAEVGENVSPNPSGYFDASVIIEHICCQDEFSIDVADGWPTASKEQMNELTASLRSVFDDWMEKNELKPKFWFIKNVKTYHAKRAIR